MQPPPWVAEQEVDTVRAAALIRARFPDLAEAAVEPLAEGWDNTVFVVDRRWAFRFPRRQQAVPGVIREIELLPRIAHALPLPIPVPEMLGGPGPDFPWPFFGARLLPGREVADAALPEADRATVAADLGRFLHDLHDPSLATVGAALPVDPMQRALPSARAALARERLGLLGDRGTWVDNGSIGDLFDSARHLGETAGPLVLVHGDLHVRHVLVGPAGTATGVIDWGDVSLADPAVDLAFGYCVFAPPERAVFLAAYGREVDRERELRARVLAVSLAAALADYADSDDRPELLAESLAGLRRAVE